MRLETVLDGIKTGFGGQRYFGLSSSDRGSLRGERVPFGQEQEARGAMGHGLFL